MPRRFNVAGPCKPELHYMLPAAARVPLARRLVADFNYFVIHAPRQTGKTTSMIALAQELTASPRRQRQRIARPRVRHRHTAHGPLPALRRPATRHDGHGTQGLA
ncbi:hypothetical protein EYB53_012035 [Candidatus Chloroploca sp. M-50]|uniref:AAA domain-containing protein n=1 Tax=Candidatus Chloroploca mongolica TaxID=2528176 RepID=A0ABS4DAI1_9CHLR|nr:hypothetical protein [Candidatus Chloroploca mongolica]MBP1466434.1 hypothetical protein [Candidatus Chloroploca mongolica]